MRKKIVELDGERMEIAPLTFSQMEDHLTRMELITGGNAVLSAADLKKPQLLEKLKTNSRVFVAIGLNNAHVSGWSGDQPVYGNGFVPWTPERVHREIDMPLFNLLRDEIMSFSGLKLVTEGEAEAASGSS
jgi:hypothetical protein